MKPRDLPKNQLFTLADGKQVNAELRLGKQGMVHAVFDDEKTANNFLAHAKQELASSIPDVKLAKLIRRYDTGVEGAPTKSAVVLSQAQFDALSAKEQTHTASGESAPAAPGGPKM